METNKQNIIEAITRDLWLVIERANDIEDSRFNDPERRGEMLVGELFDVLETLGKVAPNDTTDEDWWLENWHNPVTRALYKQATAFYAALDNSCALSNWEEIADDFTSAAPAVRLIRTNHDSGEIEPRPNFYDYVCGFILGHEG